MRVRALGITGCDVKFARVGTRVRFAWRRGVVVADIYIYIYVDDAVGEG